MNSPPAASPSLAGKHDVRRLPVGAEPRPDGVHFRVWAPRAKIVHVEIEGKAERHSLSAEEHGYHSGLVKNCGPGIRYRFRLDGRGPFPDPASRFQPEGPHGPSEVVDSSSFPWTDSSWKGLTPANQVLYELHVGTFTPAGTWVAAADQLPRLRDLGVTALEIMPVADFPGRFGWGYDGVNFFAPTRLYGRPDDFRRFVDRAHALGLGIMLDVVYNHFGPDGNYLAEFSDSYFTRRYACEWGTAINFDGPDAGPVREFFVSNAEYWITEFHLDGLRFDATQAIYDQSDEYLLATIQRKAREAARPKEIYLIAENEPQDPSLVRSADERGKGLDALWNDDFHHSSRVALTGCREAYFTDYAGSPQELISAVQWGYLFQGQKYSWQNKPRGDAALDLPPSAFVNFLENHDQVANSGHGRRLWQLSSPGRYRALTALLLLGPSTPFLFQGQEFASSKPFLYFADHQPPLGPIVAKGRRAFLGQMASLASPEVQATLPDPTDPRTFQRSTLDPAEAERDGEAIRLHRDLIALRKEDPAFRDQQREAIRGALLGPEVFLIRWMRKDLDRLLLINLGADYEAIHIPEPLLAPPKASSWRLAWSSEDVRYGGKGVRPLHCHGNLSLPGGSAILLRPEAGVS